MANWSDPRTIGASPTADLGARTAAFDAGLRSYMLSVYNYMASGVMLTGIVALLFAPYAADYLINAQGKGLSGLGWIVTLSPLAFILVMNFGLNRLSTFGLQACFWGFAGVMGLSMSTIFLAYTEASISQTFFATAAAFLGLSLWGYTTKRDLTGWGSFLLMGLVGLVVASILNMFLPSKEGSMAISAIGVLIFAGLTAYDTQRIKSMYAYVAGSDMVGKTAIMGALSLYLDFINMFQFLLSFMGQRD
jgi:FtsH-binding integral membrane protein